MRKVAAASTVPRGVLNPPCAFLHRSGTLPLLPAGNEPAPAKHGRPAPDVFSASYQRHPGESDPSPGGILLLLSFPFPSLPLTNRGILPGQALWPRSRGWRWSLCCAFSPIGLVDLTVCALFPFSKQRVELLKVPKRRKDHTGGGGPELWAKMLKEHYR